MTVKNLFERYLLALRKTPLDEKTEFADRAALQNLLQALAEESAKEISVRHEPKRAPGKGAPDYKITQGPLILGYVENKGIGENLDKVLKSDQIVRYKSLSQNIVLTDYLHFIWINKDGIQRETLCHATDLENPKFRLREDRIAAVVKLLQGFFSTPPEGIGRAQQLALALATRSQLLRDYLDEELVRQEREHKEARLYGLFQAFRDQVFHELTLKEFADAFAQMLAYGLFLARLNSGAEMVTLHNAREYVPGSFRLIRELVDFLIELDKAEYREIRWVAEEVLSIVNTLDLAAIHEDLSFKSRKSISRKVKAKNEEEWRLFSRDPFVYFYEDYLAKYDAKMKKARGVFYTPPPIVNFIVRAIDDILKETFGIKSGLADHKRVTVLDFACGTGTFLVEVLERIFENIGKGSGKRDLIVSEHILKNIYGFEYLIAPYTIAHLKLSQYLNDRGHKLAENERFQIFLTNTLEPIEPQANLLLPALTAETKEAQDVKDKKILVITGNPPYAAHSKNPSERVRVEQITTQFVNLSGKRVQVPLKKAITRHITEKTFIGSLIETYKFVDGQHFGERKHWLHDDYVKFIRFAQMKMDMVDEGVVGIITNHSYLDNPTFRGMRQSLMETFDQIWVLDLHGNAKKKERAPDGGEDKNVFDIEQGVAIGLFVKKPGAKKGVWHSDFWGTRLSKYHLAAERDMTSLGWQDLSPNTPFYFFVPREETGRGEYENGWPITAIFIENVTGIVTARDGMVIDTDLAALQNRIAEFRDLAISDAEIRQKYQLKDTRGWKLHEARKKLANLKNFQEHFRRIIFNPFDIRHIFYHPDMVDWGRDSFMRHILRGNIAIMTTRLTKDNWSVLATDALARHKAVSRYDIGYVFPLRLYNFATDKKLKADFFDNHDRFEGKERIENFSPEFRKFVDERYANRFTPEELLGFIYALLHAPTFRRKYAEFLRIDFPRIPFPEKRADFEALSEIGWELVQKHLLRDVPALGLGKYRGEGNHEVEKPRYVEAERAVYINSTQNFAPVQPDVWTFQIGGYQVIDKYLKSRKGRKLTLDEIDNVTNVTNILAFTIEQMKKIDDAYFSAFGD